MQVDLTNLIYYSYDALLFSNKQFGWSMDWGANMGNRHGWDSNQKGSRHGANLDRPSVDACPLGLWIQLSGPRAPGCAMTTDLAVTPTFASKNFAKLRVQ
jgi:hypothetical protein